MHRYIGSLLLVFWMWGAAAAQSREAAPRPAESLPAHPSIRRFTLEPTATLTVNQFGGGFPKRIKCDLEGNLYAFLNPDRGDIIRISADGKKFTTYSLADVPEMTTKKDEEIFTPEFSPGMDGDLYVIVNRFNHRAETEATKKNKDHPELDYRVISFDNDGKYHSQFKLEETRFGPTHIAVFPSGDLLLTGGLLVRSAADGPKPPMAFAGIFNDRGQLIKEIPMPKDVRFPRGTKVPRGPATNVFRYMVAGTAQAASDGNIYVVYNLPRIPIYVFSAAGEIVKTIMLEEKKSERLMNVKVSAGRLVAAFQSSYEAKADNNHRREGIPPPDDPVLRVFDAHSGEVVAEYTAPRKLGQFACYTPEVFTFLRRDDLGRVEIVRTEPR
jgi:hypothetical protein